MGLIFALIFKRPGRFFGQIGIYIYNNCKVCSSYGFCYSNLCRRSMGASRTHCGGTMEDPYVSSWISLAQCVSDGPEGFVINASSDQDVLFCVEASTVSNVDGTNTPGQTLICDNLALEGVRATASLSCTWENDTAIFQSLMDKVSGLPVNTVCHVPRSIHPLLAQVLSTKFGHTCYHGLWGFVRLFMLAKAVLCCPSRGGRKKRCQFNSHYSTTSVAVRRIGLIVARSQK